jgi:predicted nuclease of predicted toxin-antitoxin system
MPLKVMVDEDLPRKAVEILKEYGYDATSVLEEGIRGIKDAQLWITVQNNKQFLVTADKGFGDIRTYPPGEHFGILLLRPDEDGIRPVIDLLKKVLESYRLEDLVGITTVATPRGIRLRKEA